MNNNLNYSLLPVLVVMSIVAGSCQRQDPTQELAAKSDPQPVKGDLVTAMASDKVVQAFVDANEQFLNADDTYYSSLTEAGKAARRAELRAARDNGTDIVDPYRTSAQVDAFHESQARRAAQIRARFPQLAQLSEDEQENVKRKVTYAVLNGASVVSAR